MSNHLTSLAYKADVGSLLRKSVLIMLADKASDDGSGIWASKQTMADELCCSKQGILNTLHAFITEGLLAETGKRKNRNGFTITYALDIEALEALPKVKRWSDNQSMGLTSQPRGPVNEVDETSQPGGPKPSFNPPLGSEAKASSPNPRAKKNDYPAPHGVAEQIWRDFLASPKRRKAGMSATAYAGIISNLDQLAEHGFPPGPMMALAVERGWTTVKLEWVQNDESYRRSNTVGRNQPSDGLSPTTRAADFVFGAAISRDQRAVPQ